jgi:hypothetical protein
MGYSKRLNVNMITVLSIGFSFFYISVTEVLEPQVRVSGPPLAGRNISQGRSVW